MSHGLTVQLQEMDRVRCQNCIPGSISTDMLVLSASVIKYRMNQGIIPCDNSQSDVFLVGSARCLQALAK